MDKFKENEETIQIKATTSDNNNRCGGLFKSGKIFKHLKKDKKHKRLTKKNRTWFLSDYGIELSKTNKLLCDLQSTCLIGMRTKFTFTLSSYNILAPQLAQDNSYLYQKCDYKYLDWNYRKRKLFDEIKYYESDIFCFQEMQEDEYFDYFFPNLKRLGYYCLYKKRNGDKPDGCAIVFKKRKFELISKVEIDYFIPNTETFSKDNVGLIVLLRPKYGQPDERICVATTHILFSPKRGDIKLAQMQMLLAHIDRVAFRQYVNCENGDLKSVYYPIILCGDMNSSVDSKFYEFITQARLEDYDTLNRNTISGQYIRRSTSTSTYVTVPICPQHVGITDQSQYKEEIDRRVEQYSIDSCKFQCTFGGKHIHHQFNFESSYSHYNEHGDEEVTTCLPNDHKTVDYIFFHKNSHKSDDCCELKLVSNLTLFTKSQLESVYMPNKHFPSDHFLIGAKFSLE